jgi:AICAR transformylase/IMP cyclohydrolase PurH
MSDDEDSMQAEKELQIKDNSILISSTSIAPSTAAPETLMVTDLASLTIKQEMMDTRLDALHTSSDMGPCLPESPDIDYDGFAFALASLTPEQLHDMSIA